MDSGASSQVQRVTMIQPDYKDLIIPPNIAPLNFAVQLPGTEFEVQIAAKAGKSIQIRTHSPKISIPAEPWQRLLQANKGGELLLKLQVKEQAGGWRGCGVITNRIAREEIDPVLVYRKIRPVDSTWSSMGIYQRDLRSFDERPVLENGRIAEDCCHCHAFRNNDPDSFTLDVRSVHHQNTLLVVSNRLGQAIQGTVGLVAWHPKGSVLACAFSKPRLMLHTARPEMRDVAEIEGWLGYFRLGSELVRPIPGLGGQKRLLASPNWSPDGRFLYYCSAPNPWTEMAQVKPDTHTTVKYDLMRIPYDLEHDLWGQSEMVLAANSLGLSIAQPRISPDGRWLFFCAGQYGAFPAYDCTSDLYALDLTTLSEPRNCSARKLELNSDQSESWLSWSSNSRWVVFSSKRLSQRFSRPFLAYVSATGQCAKPFVLPQKDPGQYDSLMRTYTLPTLATGPVTIAQRKLVEALRGAKSRSLVLPGLNADPSPEEHP